MLGKLLFPEIQDLVARKDFRQLKEVLEELAPPDVADIISDLEDSDLLVVFRLLPKTTATEVFEHMDIEHQVLLLESLKGESVRHLLEEMSPDDRTGLLEELPPRAASRLLMMLSPEDRKVAQALLNYPDESVGRIMTPDFIYLLPEMTVEQALAKIRRIGIDRETVYALYVVDPGMRLLGSIALRKLVTSPLETAVKDLMNENVVFLTVDEDQERAIEQLRHYDLVALPVVDRDTKLVGIVTFDDLMDIMEAEHTEDVHLQAAVVPMDEPYLSISAVSMVRRRIGWLMGLMLAEAVGVLLLGRYEEQIATVIVLALFLPVMIATGGNTGTQASALVIRALATGEVALRDAFRLATREALVCLLLAVPLGAVAFLLGFLYSGEPLLGLCIGMGLATIVLMSNLTGALLPLLFKQLGMDPALMSGPFITTMIDVIGLVVYLEISVRFLTWHGIL